MSNNCIIFIKTPHNPVHVIVILGLDQRMIVLAMVQCHYDYACAMWFRGVSISAKKRLQIVQNKVIRFVMGIPPRTHLGSTRNSVE